LYLPHDDGINSIYVWEQSHSVAVYCLLQKLCLALIPKNKEFIKAGYFVKWWTSLFFNMKPLEILEK
jgi:hypothetical protein